MFCHRHAALDDVEAAGLLHHHADQLRRRAELVGRQVAPAAVAARPRPARPACGRTSRCWASRPAAAPAASIRDVTRRPGSRASWRILVIGTSPPVEGRRSRASRRWAIPKLCHPARVVAWRSLGRGTFVGLDEARSCEQSRRVAASGDFPVRPAPFRADACNSASRVIHYACSFAPPPGHAALPDHARPLLRPRHPPAAMGHRRGAGRARRGRCNGRCGRGWAPRSRSCSSCRHHRGHRRALPAAAAGLFVTAVGFVSAVLWLLPPGHAGGWWAPPTTSRC